MSSDHPRACGELYEHAHGGIAFPGSSPRMRGTRMDLGQAMMNQRIIPAHAGELAVTRRRRDASVGSSPRMRGTLDRNRIEGHHRRIIPAHAGNSARSCTPSRTTPDHPRACGELDGLPDDRVRVVGSSPRMRGTPTHVSNLLGRVRIIPAHAGNSPGSMRRYGTCSDHPRACGELIGAFIPRGIIRGSSPRMRGTQERPQLRSWRLTDHPRACGELI